MGGGTRPRTVERGKGGGGKGGGGCGGCSATNININMPTEVKTDVDLNITNVRAASNAMAIAKGFAKAMAKIQGMQRRRPNVALSVQVTSPTGDVDEKSTIDIKWITTGGTAPRTVTIELFAPQTRLDHPAGFHPIVEGRRDTGIYQWTVAVPQGHYGGLTVTGGGRGVSFPGFYIRVTVTDVSGATGSDTTPTFSIIRH